jgi:hypothetical protein
MEDKTLNNLILIESKPPNLAADFEKAKERLEAELVRFDIVVTADTLADDKKLPTEINKIKSHIDTMRKQAVADISAPIKKFDADMKALVTMCEDRRQAILTQIANFERETEKKVVGLMDQYRAELFEQLGVREEFYRAEHDDLVKPSALTQGGKLRKQERDEIQRRVQADLAVQNQTDRRMMELENRSFRAGLKSPLTRDHVRPFLFSPDETYNEEIDRIIGAELNRQHETEERLRADIEEQNRRKEAQAVVTQQPEPAAVAEPQPATEPVKQPEVERQPVQSAGGSRDKKIGCCVHCTFFVEINPGITNQAITAELRRVLENAGIKSLQEIRVERHESQRAANM